MTCIVGLKTENGILIGGDSALTAGDTVRKLTSPKVFRRGQFVIGCCDSFRVLQLAHYKLSIPPIKGKDLYKYMVTDFVEAMRKCFKMGGVARKENEEEAVDGTFVIGIRDRLFIVNSDYAVEEPLDGMAVVGSGEEYAYGALHSMSCDLPGEKRILGALEAAAYFCKSVSAPFIVVEVIIENAKKKKTKRADGSSNSENKKTKTGEKPKDSEGVPEGS